VHLVGSTIEIYYDARSYKRQTLFVSVTFCGSTMHNQNRPFFSTQNQHSFSQIKPITMRYITELVWAYSELTGVQILGSKSLTQTNITSCLHMVYIRCPTHTHTHTHTYTVSFNQIPPFSLHWSITMKLC
jgi:predicted GH43/DUF377 family glycosyl hydrolase